MTTTLQSNAETGFKVEHKDIECFHCHKKGLWRIPDMVVAEDAVVEVDVLDVLAGAGVVKVMVKSQ